MIYDIHDIHDLHNYLHMSIHGLYWLIIYIMNYELLYIKIMIYIYIRIQFSPGVKATATLNPGRNFTELFFAQTMNSSWIV